MENILEFVRVVVNFEVPRFIVLCKDFVELATLLSEQARCGQSRLQAMNAHVFFVMPVLGFSFAQGSLRSSTVDKCQERCTNSLSGGGGQG